MTPPIDDPETLRRILATTDALLLDFDGPICSVFAGFPAHVVAQQLRDVLAQGGHTNLPREIATATDPFDILFHAATLGPDEARYVETAFRAHEVEAIQTAEPTPGAHELIQAWRNTGRRLAIVSNNSIAAVEIYLEIHDLRREVNVVSARGSMDVSLLKPHPFLVIEATAGLAIVPSRCTLIGDSLADVEAARAAEVTAVGYANRPNKTCHLAESGVAVVVTGMERLAKALCS